MENNTRKIGNNLLVQVGMDRLKKMLISTNKGYKYCQLKNKRKRV